MKGRYADSGVKKHFRERVDILNQEGRVGVEAAHRDVCVLERTAQGRGLSDLSCLVGKVGNLVLSVAM